MFKDLLKPHAQLGTFLLRLGLSAIFLYHGILKLNQKGGTDWHNELTEATQLAVAWGETVCGVAMLFGLLSRLAALGLIAVMVGAIFFQTGEFDFVFQGLVLQSKPGWAPVGYEYNFALIVMCLAVLAMGSGMVSLDYPLSRWLFGPTKPAKSTPAPAPSVH